MEEITILTTMTWPAAIAILGSVVTVVVGVLTLASKAYTSKQDDSNRVIDTDADITKAQWQGMHDKVSMTRDRIGTVEGDIKVIKSLLDGIVNSLATHENRDIADFQLLSEKVDKLMKIIVEMLKDVN